MDAFRCLAWLAIHAAELLGRFLLLRKWKVLARRLLQLICLLTRSLEDSLA